MAICGNCGAENSRVRTTFHTGPHGKYMGQTDSCPSCAPGSFEPHWLRDKIVPAYEAYPTKYRPQRMEDGSLSYFATDEWRADCEAKMQRPDPEDSAAHEAAKARRRAWAKDQPKKLTQAQIESINSRKRELLHSPMARIAGVRTND